MIMKTYDANKVIDALGGTGATSRLFGIKDSSVSWWRENGIPQSRVMYLELAHPLIMKAARIKVAKTLRPA